MSVVHEQTLRKEQEQFERDQCCGRGRPRSPFPVLEMRPLALQHQDMQSVFKGRVYVVRDNIDTDQIIPAEFLNLVPTIPEEYEKLGSYALYGLPESLYATRFVKPGQLDTEYPIVVAGKNFGCGSSREHAPIEIGRASCRERA